MKIDGHCHCGYITYTAEIDQNNVSSGTPLFTTGEGTDAQEWGIRWGSITQRHHLIPKRQIWCQSAQPWINTIETLPGTVKDTEEPTA